MSDKFLSDLGDEGLKLPAEALQMALDLLDTGVKCEQAIVLLGDEGGLRLFSAGSSLLESLGMLTLAQRVLMEKE
jgi:hypothetical protein